MEGKERLLENRPRSGSNQTRCSPPGLGIVLEVKGRVLHPVVCDETNDGKVLFLIINEVVASIGINFTCVGLRSLGFEDLVEGASQVATVCLSFALGEMGRGRFWNGTGGGFLGGFLSGGKLNFHGVVQVAKFNLTFGGNTSEEGVQKIGHGYSTKNERG